MLDNKVFLQGINYLKATYLNWNFDLNNDLMLKVWYKKLSGLNDETFMRLIEKYTDECKFSPQSPGDLLEHLKEVMARQLPNANDVWVELLKLIRYYGFNYHADKIYEKISNNPILTKTVKQFEYELTHLETNDPYTPQRFKAAYVENMEEELRNTSSLLLEANATKLLK